MDDAIYGRLGAGTTRFRWLFEPAGEVNDSGRSFLLGQLLGAPVAAVMGSFCAIVVVTVATASYARGREWPLHKVLL